MPTEPTRVVHLITDLDAGGAEMMLSRLVGVLDRSSIESTVISLTSGGRLSDEIAARGTNVIALGMRPGHLNIGALVKCVHTLRALRPDVLQTWMYHADLIGLIAGRMAGVRTIAWNIRCSQLSLDGYSRWLSMEIRTLATLSRHPRAIVCNSLAGKRSHEALGYRPLRWEIIPNGIDLERATASPSEAAAVRRELGIGPEVPLIGLVARLHPMKDHATFVKAAALVLARRPDAQIVMAGRGVADDPVLAALVQTAGIAERTHLLSERRDVPAVLAALNVLVSSSDSAEGFPNILLEAMAAGTPCVATDVGDSALILGDNGFIVPAREPELLADAIARMLSLDRDRLEAMTAAARARVARDYTLASVARRYDAFYRSLATDGGTPD